MCSALNRKLTSTLLSKMVRFGMGLVKGVMKKQKNG